MTSPLKLGMITSGGGMKCAWGAGVTLALKEIYNIIFPDTLISGSGSSGTGTYYLAQKYDFIRYVWTEKLATKKMLNWRRFRKVIDIDHLIDDIFKTDHPLTKEEMQDTITHHLVSALDRNTGHITYFSNKEKMYDWYEVLRATKSLPVFSQWNPKIKVHNGLYCDSYLSSRSRTHYERIVEEEGATHIIVINNSPEDLSNNKLDRFFRWWMNRQPKHISSNYFQQRKEILSYELPQHVNLVHLKASELPIDTLINNKECLEKAFDQGYQYAKESKELYQFLKECPSSFFGKKS